MKRRRNPDSTPDSYTVLAVFLDQIFCIYKNVEKTRL